MEIGTPSNNIEFQYTDKELDDTDLYYFQARYYDGIAGRFWGRDKIHLEYDLTKFFHTNPYVFTKNNPLKYVDADGRDAALYTTPLFGVRHMGSFYQDRFGNWYRQDLGPVNPITSLSFKDVKADWRLQFYGQKSKEEILDIIKNDTEIIQAMYFEIDDPDKDQAIANFYTNAMTDMASGRNNYNLGNDNCAINTLDGFNEGGFQLEKNFIPRLAYDKAVNSQMEDIGTNVFGLMEKVPQSNNTFGVDLMREGVEVIK
jgi:RHS repeat-associated protein